MIKLLTDGCANLSKKYLSENNIETINLSLFVDEKEVDISSNEFDLEDYYKKIRNKCSIKTSLISIQNFVDFFESNLLNNDEIIFIGISNGISGSTSCAKNAKDILEEKYPNKKIAVINSIAASLGEGMLVMKAAKMIKSGCSFDDITKNIENAKAGLCQLFMVTDLKYLRDGGRISNAGAAIGTVLNIKPILMGDPEGKIVVYKKSRGVKTTLENIADEYDKKCKDKSKDIAITHTDNEEYAQYLLRCLYKKGFKGKSIIEVYEPVTGSHVGPDAVALFFEKDVI